MATIQYNPLQLDSQRHIYYGRVRFHVQTSDNLICMGDDVAQHLQVSTVAKAEFACVLKCSSFCWSYTYNLLCQHRNVMKEEGCVGSTAVTN
jgi:hypothetical protein